MESLPSKVSGITWAAADIEGGRALRAARDSRPIAGAEFRLREVAPGEFRADVTGEVAAECRGQGIGTAMLAWAEAAARVLFFSKGYSGALTLCANTESPDESSRALFAAHGLELAVAEDEMRRPLIDLPARPLPAGLIARPWDEHAQPLFFHAYSRSFRDRPGFPNWEESRWRASFIDHEAFRPELSSVILDGPEPAAFAVIGVEADTGWITQMGVRPQWRGKGLGEALLAAALAGFAAEGLRSAALEVATNNPNARALYERMGFTVAGSYESWRKRLL